MKGLRDIIAHHYFEVDADIRFVIWYIQSGISYKVGLDIWLIEIIFFIPYYILKGLYFIFLVPRIILPSLPDYECKSKKIISISQISKPTLYEMPD